MLGYKSKSSFGGGRLQRQEKQTGAQAAGEGAARLGRFGGAMKGATKDDAVTRIQKYAQAEGERQRKKKQEEAAKPKSTAPQKGFFSRMYDRYVSGKKE